MTHRHLSDIVADAYGIGNKGNVASADDRFREPKPMR